MKILEKKKNYTVFGLRIESALWLPELFTSEGPADVSIEFGHVPAHIEAPLEKTPWYELAAGQFLLRVEGTAKYYAEEGKRVLIEPDAAGREEDIRVFLLCTVLAALLQQRGLLVLHGFAANIGGETVAFLAPTSVGKTTIALSLYDRGYKLLSDEICAVGLVQGKPVVFPGYPRLYVWRDALARSGKDVHLLQPVRQGLEKYLFNIEDGFSPEPAALSEIVELKMYNKKAIEIEPVRGSSRFESLLKNTFFGQIASDPQKRLKQFAMLAMLPYKRISFSHLGREVEKTVGRILEVLEI